MQILIIYFYKNPKKLYFDTKQQMLKKENVLVLKSGYICLDCTMYVCNKPN